MVTKHKLRIGGLSLGATQSGDWRASRFMQVDGEELSSIYKTTNELLSDALQQT